MTCTTIGSTWLTVWKRRLICATLPSRRPLPTRREAAQRRRCHRPADRIAEDGGIPGGSGWKNRFAAIATDHPATLSSLLSSLARCCDAQCWHRVTAVFPPPQVVITTPPPPERGEDDYSNSWYSSHRVSEGGAEASGGGGDAAPHVVSGGDGSAAPAGATSGEHAADGSLAHGRGEQGEGSERRGGTDAASAGAAGLHGSHLQPPPPSARVHVSARPSPVATECHALGNLSDFSYSLIEQDNPEAGVALSFGGGDTCLKRVITFPPSRGAGGAKGVGAWEEAGTIEADATSTKVDWVPTPRQARRDVESALRSRETCAPILTPVAALIKIVQLASANRCRSQS